MKKTWQRFGSILVVLAMLLACTSVVFAADDVTVYLKPSENWLQGGARFAVYYFGGSEQGWVDMTASGDGFYSAAVPSGMTIIICRMNPGATENNWDNKWNQTGNLELQSGGKNCFYQPATAWNDAGNEYWGTLTEAPKVDEPVITGYTVAGDSGLCGAAWDPAQNAMTETSTGIWEITFTNIAAGTYYFKVTDGTWTNSWGVSGGNAVVSVDAASDVTVTFNADTKEITAVATPVGGETPDPVPVTYTVAGDSDLCGAAWDPSQNAMTETSTGIWEITFFNIAAGTYKFKVTDGSWTNSWGANGGDYNVGVAVLSNVTITFNADTKEITTSLEPLTDEEPTAYTVKLHFLPGEGWGSPINAWVWMNESDSIPGYEDYHMSWPGKAIAANAEHEGWYDLTVSTYNAGGFKIIFNDGSNQTLNLFTGALTGDVELWFIGNQRYTYAPEEWSGTPVYTYSIYFHNQGGWENVYAYAWVDSDQFLGPWTGTAAAPAGGNDGWFYVTFAVPYEGIKIIFNDGNGTQIGDVSVAVPEGARSVEAWIEEPNVSYTAPEGWNAVRPGNTVKIHFMPPYTSWGEKIYAWIWNGGGDLPGYEEYHKNWPGKRVEKDPDNDGWYLLEVTTELSDFNFIFSGKRQTRDLYIDNITGDMEIWVYGNDFYNSKPDLIPATGDNANPALYAGLVMISILAMGAVVLTYKKKSV